MKSFYKFLLALMFLAVPALAVAGGVFQGYPAATLPLTGSETIPADTNASYGAQTKNVAVSTLKQFFSYKVALTDAASITTDASLAKLYTVTLGGNRTLNDPSNLWAGASWDVVVTQDATGSRTLNYGSLYKWSGGTAPTLSTTAGSVDLLRFLYDGTRILGTSVLNVK